MEKIEESLELHQDIARHQVRTISGKSIDEMERGVYWRGEGRLQRGVEVNSVNSRGARTSLTYS